MKRLLLVGVCLAAAVAPALSAQASGTTGVVTEFAVAGLPTGIVAGPDGNLWFTDYAANEVGRITVDGTVTEFTAGLTAGSGPFGITAGPDGNLWFTEVHGDRIGRITPAGVITEFSVGITSDSNPYGITSGPDGNLWFAEQLGVGIGRITPDGVVTEFSAGIASGSFPSAIAAGSDGNMWFSEIDGIGRITPAGLVTEFNTGIASGGEPFGLAAGPDGNMWFTEHADNRIGRITPDGVVTEFSAGITGGSQPSGIVLGPDGNLWFTEYQGNRLGRITPDGVVSEFSAGITSGSSPRAIAAGSDGNLWFTEENGRRIGLLELSSTGSQRASTTILPGTLALTVAQPTVAFGPLRPGETADVRTGTISYTNTLGFDRPWAASVAATDLTAGPRTIPAGSLSYAASALTPGTESAGDPPVAGRPDAFTFLGCSTPGDVSPGVSYSCPHRLFSATGATKGDWVQSGNVVSLHAPAGQEAGAYAGTLQYSLVG